MNTFQKIVFCIGIAAIVAMPFCIWRIIQYKQIHSMLLTPEKISTSAAFFSAYEFTKDAPSGGAKRYLHSLMDNQCAILMSLDDKGHPVDRALIHKECDKWLDAGLLAVRKTEDEFCKSHSEKPECAPEKLDALFVEMRNSYRKARDEMLDIYLKEITGTSKE